MRAPTPFALFCGLCCVAGPQATRHALAQDVQAGRTPVQRHTLGGVVVDEQGEPIPGTELLLRAGEQLLARTRADADGRFSFAALPAGVVSVGARRIGYQARSVGVEITPGAPATAVEIRLVAVPAGLEPVLVADTADDVAIRLESFERHRSRGRFGYFVDREEIKRRKQMYVSELVRRVPGAAIAGSARIGNTVRLRGCRPLLWLDGVVVPEAEVDEVVRPEDVLAMEIYASWGGLPAEYMDRRAGACGALVVWTR